jgi:YidC/Oxa1 family membrane protein insertase
MTPENRNLWLAVLLSVGVLILYQIFYVEPNAKAERARVEAQKAAAAAAAPKAPAGAAAAPAAPAVPAGPVPREQALAQTPRIAFDSPLIDGSISLAGARIDDLSLKRYRETVDPKSPEVTLLKPQGSEGGYYAFFGWSAPEGGAGDLPGPNTVWTAPAGARLTPATPVTLTWRNAQGLEFARTIAVDERYMFTVTDRVTNRGAAPVAITPYGAVRRHGVPKDLHNLMILHEGTIAVLGLEAEKLLKLDTYRNMIKGEVVTGASIGGWLGITDKYWLTALVPDPKERIEATMRMNQTAQGQVFETTYLGSARQIGPGQEITKVQRVFAGAKKVRELQAYEEQLSIPRFVDAVDWGNFWFLTKPFFWLLSTFEGWIGNFGLAILATTVVIKLLAFPLVNTSYEAMAKLRKLAPKMKEIQERFAADKQRQQQEMVKLYQTEKVNPVAGCLPILIQIPIFYALYKTLTVTLEMRHAPFFGWINDLSAKDPTTVFNLFGLLPFDPTALPVIGTFLALGAWPILYGLSLWLVQSMNPPAPDPLQQRIFALMPIIFTFVFAPFAAGLVIYWTWSNVLSILQQYVIMRKNEVENPIDSFFARFSKKPAAS